MYSFQTVIEQLEATIAAVAATVIRIAVAKITVSEMVVAIATADCS
jgi:hypothetical protein